MPDENTFELPETLPTEPTELNALLAQAEKAFQDRYDSGASTPEDLAELQALAEPVRRVRDAITASQTEPEVVPEAPVEPAPEVEPEAPAEPEAPVEPEAPSASKAVLDALLLSPSPAGAPAPAPAPVAAAPAPAPVVAAPAAPVAPAVPASLAAAVVPVPDYELPIAAASLLVITAAANVPGFVSAQTIDGMAGLVKAMGEKARALPDARGTTGDKGHMVASIQKPLSPDRNLDGLSEKEQFEKIQDMASVEFLVAAGGWCAPSETIYDFACEVEAPPEMIVLPTNSTARGGQRFPISPTFRDFRALENNGLFTWTEADDISALTPPPTKPCFHIPCVTFDEARLELEGLCVTAGNLTDLAYPELIRRYMSLVLTAHLHRMNTQKILKMLALVDDSVVLAGTFAAASATLAGLELQVQDLRDQFGMSENAVIESMAPRWLRGPIRADVARRECCGLDTVSNADVDRYLEAAGIRLQFVSNWQDMGDPDVPALLWPTEVQVLLWLPGAYRELTGPSLDIAVARDSVLNETNDFTVAFTEESYQIYKPGCGSRLVTIPICPSGASGERVEMVCEDES